MTYKINGKEVEYLNIKKEPDGDIIVEYGEKFNLVKAHTGVTIQKLRDEGLKNIHVIKYLKYKIIILLLNDSSELHDVLHTLHIPPSTYELSEDLILVIDTPIYERAIGVENPVTLTDKCLKYTY